MTETTEKIEALKIALENDSETLERCLLLLFERQTADEQESHNTKEKNSIGFSGCDARKLTYYANWVKSGRHLSDRFLEDAKKRLLKYAGQLIRLQAEPQTAEAQTSLIFPESYKRKFPCRNEAGICQYSSYNNRCDKELIPDGCLENINKNSWVTRDNTGKIIEDRRTQADREELKAEQYTQRDNRTEA